MVLTADMGACLELGRHGRVHGYHNFFLLGHQCIALFHLLVDPVLEVLAKYSSTHIHDPLLWYFPKVRLVRKVQVNPPSVAHVVEDLLK